MLKILMTHIFLSFFLLHSAFAQMLPPSRQTDWTQAGYFPYDIAYDSLNILDFGGNSSGLSPNDAALQAAFAFLGESPGIIHFPKGTYYFTQPVQLPAFTVLKGEGAQQTTLFFNIGGSDHLIKMRGEERPEVTTFVDSSTRGSNRIHIQNPGLFQPGDYIRIFSDDQDVVTSAWANKSTGQIGRIKAIEGNMILLEKDLRRDYLLVENPGLVRVNPVEGSGLECIRIEREDISTGQTSNLYFEYAANCFIKNVESVYCNFSHTDIRNSTKISITGCYFHHAFNYGNGGKAYGVTLHFSTGECLVENNVFEVLRHAILLQAGANGNVIAYNYSHAVFWEGVGLPPDSAGDLVLHGNYPYGNLFEGNIVQNIVIDDSHGINGPFNTFFRNRAELYGVFMGFNPSSDSQNFLGNEVTNTTPPYGVFFLTGNNHFLLANNVGGNIQPPGSASLSIPSLYRDTPPSYFGAVYSWPPIGPPNVLGEYDINARQRYEAGAIVLCSEAEETTRVSSLMTEDLLDLFPNPFKQTLTLEVREGNPVFIDIYSSCGHLLHTYPFGESLNLSALPPAIYILKVIFQDESILVKRVVKI